MKPGEGSADAAGPGAGRGSGSGTEPEVTPLPAPMPGLSMELEALEPEEPSLAPLAKLPGVVARTGQSGSKKLKATHSPGGKSSGTGKGGASGQKAGGAKAATGDKDKPERSGKNDGGEGKAKPTGQSPKEVASSPTPLRGNPKAEPAPMPPPVLAMPETLPLAPPPPLQKAGERSRAWWVIGALGLVALGAGVGALLWQPTAPSPLPPEQPTVVAAAPPRTALTVTPIEAAAGPAPVPVVEALPPTPAQPAAPAGAEKNAKGSSPAAPAAPETTVAAVRTTSKPPPTGSAATPKPATKAPPATAAAPASKPPGGDGAAGKTAGKPTAKPAATAAATPLSLEPVPQLSPPIIRQHMLAAERRFPSCVREGFGSNVSIGIVVESAGTVRKADILGPLGQSATGRCISEQIRGLRFPPFTEGGASKFFVWSYQVPQAN